MAYDSKVTANINATLSFVFMMLTIGLRSRMKKELINCNGQLHVIKLFKYDLLIFFSIRDLAFDD